MIPAIVAALLVVVVALPWIIPPPERAPAFMMIRPRGRDHPELIWYFFRRSVTRGRALLPILIGVVAGSVSGALAGAASGFFRVAQVTARSVDCLERQG